jgi:hypothetical protein
LKSETYSSNEILGSSGRVVANRLVLVGVSVTFLISIGFEYLVTLTSAELVLFTVVATFEEDRLLTGIKCAP